MAFAYADDIAYADDVRYLDDNPAAAITGSIGAPTTTGGV